MSITTRKQTTHYTIELYSPKDDLFFDYTDTNYTDALTTLSIIPDKYDILKFYGYNKIFRNVYAKPLTEHFTDTLARQFAQQDHDDFIDYFAYYIDNMEC